MREKKVSCCRCNLGIDTSKEKFVLLGTYTGKDVNDENYFHFECFRIWFHEKIQNQIKARMNRGINMMKGVVSQFGGKMGFSGILNGDADDDDDLGSPIPPIKNKKRRKIFS